MKSYVKPELYFESFELSEHIAACGLDMSNSTNVNNCTATADTTWGYTEPFIAFTGNNAGCKEVIEAYCYTTEDGGLNIFNS